MPCKYNRIFRITEIGRITHNGIDSEAAICYAIHDRKAAIALPLRSNPPMMNPSEVQEQSRTNGNVDETQNVDRIRDILFGPQMRDYDSRFQRLEERLALEANNLRW